MVYLAFLETTTDFGSDQIIATFHEMLEIAEREFLANNDLISSVILKEFRQNDPTIGEEH